MSENEAVMRRGFAAFSRGDWDACLADMEPEIEWHVTFALPDLPPDQKVFRGHDEVRMLFDNIAEAWEGLTLEMEEVLFDDDDVLITRARFAGRGRGSGIEVDRRLFYVQELRDHKLLRQRPFETESEAFVAAGVERG